MDRMYKNKLAKLKGTVIIVASTLFISSFTMGVQANPPSLAFAQANLTTETPAQLAPTTLNGLKITYNILDYQNNGLPPDYGNYPTKGTFTHVYDESIFIANNFDAFSVDFTATYQVDSTTDHGNQFIYKHWDDYAVTTLNFNAATSGTFAVSLLGGAGLYTGDFFTEQAIVQGFSPKDVVNGSFSLNITSLEGKVEGDDLPPVGATIKTHFAKHTKMFLRSDLYDEWDIVGDYFYQRKNDNTAQVNTYLRQSGRNIAFKFTFSSIHEGEWTAEIGNGEATVKGNFYYGTNPPPENYAYAQGSIVKKREMSSEHTTRSYPYRVYLPRDYFTSDKEYPVIYSTDGQWLFWDFSKAIDRRHLDVIFVAIEAAPGELRQADYTLPGSTQYLEFLKQELIPEIEKSYRVSKVQRTLVGFSYGGTLVRHAFIDSVYSKTFTDFVSIDPAIGEDNTEFQMLEYAAIMSNPSFDGSLVLTGGDIIWDGNGYFVGPYAQNINALNLPGLSVYYQPFHLRHTDISVPSFEFALDQLFD